MTPDAIASVCSPSVSWMAMPPLQRPLHDASTLSNKMEMELRRMISEYREGEGLSTSFDDQCSYMLSMALSAYETERITGEKFTYIFYIYIYFARGNSEMCISYQVYPTLSPVQLPWKVCGI